VIRIFFKEIFKDFFNRKIIELFSGKMSIDKVTAWDRSGSFKSNKKILEKVFLRRKLIKLKMGIVRVKCHMNKMFECFEKF
jgi:hypothetical protein